MGSPCRAGAVPRGARAGPAARAARSGTICAVPPDRGRCAIRPGTWWWSPGCRAAASPPSCGARSRPGPTRCASTRRTPASAGRRGCRAGCRTAPTGPWYGSRTTRRCARRSRGSGAAVVVHDCGTQSWVRRWLARDAVRRGRSLHLLLLDVPAGGRAGRADRARQTGDRVRLPAASACRRKAAGRRRGRTAAARLRLPRCCWTGRRQGECGPCASSRCPPRCRWCSPRGRGRRARPRRRPYRRPEAGGRPRPRHPRGAPGPRTGTPVTGFRG